MDNLTHGLLGLAIGSLRRPDGGPARGTPFSSTDKALLLGAAVAAELPDLDNLIPAANEVIHALHAHRGISHSLVAAPLWALAATALAALIFRGARAGPTFAYSLASVVFAHLAPDLWTGWGTRLLLPFSDERLSLDLTSVIDPFFTLPLIAAALYALLRRRRWRPALIAGLCLSAVYLGYRTTSRALLIGRLHDAYPAASRVEVFPALLSVSSWRFVAVHEDFYVAGVTSLGAPHFEQRQVPTSPPLPSRVRENSTVREALAWARMPVTSVEPLPGGVDRVQIGDLRYHLGGEPTLSIVVEVGADGEAQHAALDRGGSARELLGRWQSSRE